MFVYTALTRPYWKKTLHGRRGKNRDTGVQDMVEDKSYYSTAVPEKS